MQPKPITPRAYLRKSTAASWEEIWEAGPYYDRISELLEDARRYAIFVGWQVDSRLQLKIPVSGNSGGAVATYETLREKVIRICEEKPEFNIYFLVWDHAYFYIFEREGWQGRVWEDVHPRVHFVFDNRHPLGGSHHEKLCIIDGNTALCGGIDLCDDRWDTPLHPYFDLRRSLNWKIEKHGPYHDAAVQVTGSICRDIQSHVVQRWVALSSIPIPIPVPYDSHEHKSAEHLIYLSRTVVQLNQKIEIAREIEFLFRDLIAAAEKRIILEGQYYWSKVVNDLLVAKVLQMRGKDFEIILILADLQKIKSPTRYMMAYELALLQKLEAAANFSGVRCIIGAPTVLPPPNLKNGKPKEVYIHSKVLVIDDRFLGIGSANFADRALRVDTEVNLTFEARTERERAHVRNVGQEILSHWNLDKNLDCEMKRSSLRSHLRFKRFKPSVDLENLPRKLDLTRFIAWDLFFDPSIPWFYSFRLKYQRLIRKNFGIAIMTVFLVWMNGGLLAWVVSGVEGGGSRAAGIFLSLLLASVWLIPIPFVLTLLLASRFLEPNGLAKLGVASFWIAFTLGYYLTRFFPLGVFSRRVDRESPPGLSVKLGTRSFSALVSVLIDPRISVHAKIVYQGIYHIPVPWVVLGSGLFLAAVFYTFARWVIPFIILEIPSGLLAPLWWVVAVLVASLSIRGVAKAQAILWTKKN